MCVIVRRRRFENKKGKDWNDGEADDGGRMRRMMRKEKKEGGVFETGGAAVGSV